MDQTTAYLIAATVLALPGPTNTLMALSGSALGWRPFLPLVTAALAGYGVAITALAVIAIAGPQLPALTDMLRLIAAVVLVHAAFRLWHFSGWSQAPGGERAAPVRWTHVFLTTLLNPKAVVLYVTLFPPSATGGADLALAISTLALVIAAASAMWIGLGSKLSTLQPAEARRGWIERGGAVVLLAFAAIVSSPAFAAMLS